MQNAVISTEAVNELLGYILLTALGVVWLVLYIRARRRDKAFRVWRWILQALADCITPDKSGFVEGRTPPQPTPGTKER